MSLFRATIICLFVTMSAAFNVQGMNGNKQLISFGFQCPDLPSMAGFDKSRYVGTWYEYSKFSNFFQRNLKCVSAIYGDDGNGGITVRNEGFNEDTDASTSINGGATVPDPSKPGELLVKFSQFDFSRRANYIVVDTDYDSYALVYSCTKIPILPINIQYLWILTRAAGVAPSNLSAIFTLLRDAGVNPDRLRVTEQTDCPIR